MSKKQKQHSKRYRWYVIISLLIFLFGTYQYREYRVERDFELQCAYYYCLHQVRAFAQTGDQNQMDYYYQVAKDFHGRISNSYGMDNATRELELIYWRQQE